MNIRELDPVQIRKLGLKALVETLGPVGMVYFLNFYELGISDYTKERKKWLGKPFVEDILKDMKKDF